MIPLATDIEERVDYRSLVVGGGDGPDDNLVARLIGFTEDVLDHLRVKAVADFGRDADQVRASNWKAVGVMEFIGQDETAAGRAVGDRLNEAGAKHAVCVNQVQGHIDLEARCAGLPSEAATEVVRSRPDGVEIRYGIDAAGRLISAAAVGPGNIVAKDIRLAEMAIGKRVVADPAAVADPGVNFKQLLR